MVQKEEEARAAAGARTNEAEVVTEVAAFGARIMDKHGMCRYNEDGLEYSRLGESTFRIQQWVKSQDWETYDTGMTETTLGPIEPWTGGDAYRWWVSALAEWVVGQPLREWNAADGEEEKVKWADVKVYPLDHNAATWVF